ncbi:MAG TPA: penicillin acylase family protein, partial [Longimicrobium sp.]|uniref:penicillin acylase family protein n=1 Tax=Longimicrobium sp. TaxID=2029185 RepID=UPI002EDBB5CD
MLKKIGIALLALVFLLGVIAGGGRWWLGRSQADPTRGAAIAGLSAPVEVWRDSLGVPHVWARTDADLFRAIGYVHAQDRLFQMEMFRRVADGRLAEILGEPLLKTDRFLRTVGMGRAAAENERRLAPEERRLLQAYADGVNAWIRGHPGPLPPEFVTLRFSPEPWTVRNSLSLGKIMAWDLADWETGLIVQRALDAVGEELGRDLIPAYPDSGLTILGGDAQWRGRSATPVPAPRPTAARVEGHVPVPEAPALALQALDAVSTTRASNGWVIGGSRTRSGKPIVANDMHLGLRAPSLWYLAALHGGGFNITGMMLPGVPIVVVGHSDRIAWGYTNAMVDDVDFYVEQTDPRDGGRYRTPAGWERFAVREETIRVKGERPVVQRVRASRHGPVLSDVEPRAAGRVLAMRWTAHDPSPEFRALMGMNRARSAGEFLAALRDFRSPHQNVVFADADGAFGYWMGGRVPVRRSGDGVLPVPGWTGEGDWTRYL